MKSIWIFLGGVALGAATASVIAFQILDSRSTAVTDLTSSPQQQQDISKNPPLLQCPEPEPVQCPELPQNIALAPPAYDTRTPEVIETNIEGEARVRWTEVEGAKRYRVSVLDDAGKIVKTFRSTRTVLYLKEIPLPPGMNRAEYWVAVSSLNENGLEGRRGEKRKLIVKGQAMVVAPTIKVIRIEE